MSLQQIVFFFIETYYIAFLFDNIAFLLLFI